MNLSLNVAHNLCEHKFDTIQIQKEEFKMTTQEYISTYQANKENFEKYFKENAEQYWKLWKLHKIDHVSYDKLASQYNYSKSNIKCITDKVAAFLDNPVLKDENDDFLSKDLSGSLMYPNEFIGKIHLSLNAHKIWTETILLYQKVMPLEIPRNHIILLSTQYKNVDRRNNLFEELRQLKIKIDENEEIQAFTKVNDNHGNMSFEFTDECLNYIDPFRQFLKYLTV